ncbi:MAG: leucine-rich repeat domain-containing protein [Muribaculaceae bacterium]|nr:leucine-rich repeat domain-containing protein [Muribaculaceae bacterium]
MKPIKHTKYTYLTCLAITAMMVCGIGPHALAYDFSALNDHGQRIYYNLLSENDVEVTYDKLLSPTYTYSGSLDIPATVIYWGKERNVVALGERAFFGCRHLKAVNLPVSVKKIGEWAFGWCDSIAVINLPAGVSSLPADVFDGCYGLEKITTDEGNSLHVEHGTALYAADGKTLTVCIPTVEGTFEVSEGTERIGARALGGCTFVDSVRIASSVRGIGRDAFSFCNNLREIHLPAAVEEIESKAFADCFMLERIDVDTANVNFASYDGALYTRDFSRLIQHPGARTGMRLHPQTREIGESAFLDSYGLTAINLPDSTKTIGTAAFAGCERLESVVIPESVGNIRDLAFGMCPTLENVYALATRPREIQMGEGVFAGVDAGRCTLYVPRGCREAYAACPGWSEITDIVEMDAFAPQTIEWHYSLDRRIDDDNVELSATATSGLEVSYSISPASKGLATISGNILTMLTDGAIYVTAYQPGSAMYLPAESVTHIYNDGAGIEETSADAVRVFGLRGEIAIEGAEENDVADVYDIDGKMVYSGHARRIKTDGNRIYLVRIGRSSHKVAVR